MTDPGLSTAIDGPDPDLPPTDIRLAREPPFKLGAMTIQPMHRRVVHDDGRGEILEPRVMQVLVALAKAQGRILSRDDLIASCWAGVVVSEDALNRAISRLRRVAQVFGEFQIETITKVGYRLASGDDGAAPAGPARTPSLGPSICVLPFTNMSGDPEQEYFSDGISEDIITDLSKVSSLFVVSRTTAFTFRDEDLDLHEVAKQLRVGHLLVGSVRKAGGRVRITAQLVEGATGGHVWAERYDRDLGDIFAVQDEISNAIVTALKLKLLPQEKQAFERRGTDSAEAYDLYLMARSYYLAGNYGDPRRDEAIERLSRRAVEIDPGYTKAWALLASGQYSLHRNHARPGDGGQIALDQALILDPDLAEARALKALMLSEASRHDEASAEIAVALRLEPQSYEVNWRAGFISYNQGRLAEAIPFFEQATALTETDIGSPTMLISCYTALGDAENARRMARIVLERAEKAAGQDRTNGYALSAGVAALAALEEWDRASDWMRRGLLIDPDNLLMRYSFACTLARSRRDDPEAALGLLRPLLEQDTGRLVAAAPTDPDLAGLRRDPRFQAMLAAAAARLAETKPADATGVRESAPSAPMRR